MTTGRLVAALLLTLSLAATITHAQPGLPLVVVDTAKMVNEHLTLESVGEAQAIRSVTLYPESSGRVVQINIPATGHVSQGMELVLLDNESEAIALALAEVRVADARRLLDRYQRIKDPTIISPTTVDEAQKALDIAELELKQAEVELAQRSVVAPFTGYLGLYDIEIGDRIHTDTVIAQLDDRSHLQVRFTLPEQYFDRLSVGDTVSVFRWAQPNEELSAEIRQIDSRIDPKTATFTIESTVNNEADLLRPGMTLRVVTNLLGAEQIQVAETAVQWGDSGAYVWVVRDDHAERVGINLVGRQNGSALIKGDVKAGERVVVEGVQRLRPGVELAFTTAEQLDGTAPLPAVDRQSEGVE